MSKISKIFELIIEHSKILSIIFMSLGVFIILFGTIFFPLLLNLDISPVGRFLVFIEIDIIPGLIYMKPITISVFLIAIGYLLGIEYVDSNCHLNINIIRVISILSLFIFFLSLYEVLYNFMLWGSLISSVAKDGEIHYNIDTLENIFPNPEQAWNLVFATKIFTLLSFLSAITFLYSLTWKKKLS